MSNLYLIKNELGRYKIGISIDVGRRIKTLMMGGGAYMNLIKTWSTPFASAFEECFHARYVDHHCFGEWFDLPEDPTNEMDTLFKEASHTIQKYNYDPDKARDVFEVERIICKLVSNGKVSHKRGMRIQEANRRKRGL